MLKLLMNMEMHRYDIDRPTQKGVQSIFGVWGWVKQIKKKEWWALVGSNH